ncbi:hypothetical protein HYT58_00300, partial [Candidatus Woesearchaeota archaeon]|nr:hypothetical protein [Candidatus Woesearchaeota archaeon]
KIDFKKIRASTSESDMVVFVFFNKINNNNEVKKNIPNSRTIYVDYTNNNLKFFDKNIESFYLGEEMLIGAIFNPDNYECVKERALGRLGNLSILYKSKANFLLLKEPREDCRSKLVSIAGTLDTFTKQKTKASLYEIRTNIEKQNDLLEKNDCAKTY